jgi:NTE family protein
MGGLIGAAYAIGLSPQDLEAEALRLSHFRELIKLIDWKPGRRGLPGKRLYNYLADRLGDIITFADLSLPLALIAVDLISGQEVVLKEGRVVEAMRATMSLPSVFDPVEINGYQLVDGGLLNNVPADVARQLGAEIVIAVDVMPNFSPNKPGEPPLIEPILPPGFMPIPLALWQKEQIMVSALTEARLKQAKPDLILRPDIPKGVTSLFGFSRTADIIAAGEAATDAALPRLHQLVT